MKKKILFICKYLSTSKNGFETRLSTIINLFNKNSNTTILNPGDTVRFQNISKKEFIKNDR